MVLEEYNYELRRITGKENDGADYYSRNFIFRENKTNLNEELLSKILEVQKENNNAEEIDLHHLTKENIRIESVDMEYYVDKDRKLYLFEKKRHGNTDMIHDYLIHPGISKFYYTIKEEIFAKRMKNKIVKIVKECRKCQENKHYRNNFGELSNFIVAKEPKMKVSSNILGPIIDEYLTKGLKRYLISFTDVFSRYTKLFVIRNIKSSTITQKFKIFLEKEFVPKKILTDQGRQYVAKEFNNLCSSYQIKHQYSVAFTPTANSISERINGIINTTLRIYRNEKSLKEIVQLAKELLIVHITDA